MLQGLENNERRDGSGTALAIFSLTVLALVCSAMYLVLRVILFVLADYPWYDKTVAMTLLLAEAFMLVHSVGYFLNMQRVIKRRGTRRSFVSDEAVLLDYPPVAIIVASYREPIHIVEDTLVCFKNLTYPDKHIYFLDDTRYDDPRFSPEEHATYRSSVDEMCRRLKVDLFRHAWRGAKAGMINDFLRFRDGDARSGSVLERYSSDTAFAQEKYIIIFDADQNPFPDFVEPIVAQMEENPKLAFVQTPQYYTNFATNRVARASGLQQVVFFEYICEGKGAEDAMFCCGTNVVFRRDALRDVGGLDESSVTEDFATSLEFHLRGWQSSYVNRVSAFGMGPEDLGAFFKQQFRWALGCVSQVRRIVAHGLKEWNKLPLNTWWEYFLSSTYYIVGWAFLFMVLAPVLYIFCDVPTIFVYPEFYFVFFAPYLLLTLSLFFWTLYRRNYRPIQILSGMILISITFPVYMRASLLGLLGYRGRFVVTPKGGSSSLPMSALWAQIALAVLCFAAVVWAFHRIVFEGQLQVPLLLNALWCSYFFVVLSGMFYFNNPEGAAT